MNQCPYVFLSEELSSFLGLVLNRQSTLYSCSVRNWLWQVQENVERRARAPSRAQQKPTSHYYAQQHFSTFPPPGTALVPQRNTALIPGQSRQTPKSDANNLPQIANLIQVFTISIEAFSQAGSSPQKVYLKILVKIVYGTIKAKNLNKNSSKLASIWKVVGSFWQTKSILRIRLLLVRNSHCGHIWALALNMDLILRDWREKALPSSDWLGLTWMPFPFQKYNYLGMGCPKK